MDAGTAARLRDVDTLAIDEFHLKIVDRFDTLTECLRLT